jgi:predicted nucleic acid-binding protein
VRIYLDTSVLVALLTNDPFTARADAYLRAEVRTPIVSDFASAEFASALSRRVRVGEITSEEARASFADLDAWVLRTAERIETTADVLDAESFLRRLDLTLRTPDALNIALCRRASAVLLTFDDKMAACALRLGLNVAPA